MTGPLEDRPATSAPQATRPTRPTRVCALLTCFDRRPLTLACLRALGASTGLDHVELHAVLVDDASRDGTADAVRAEFPWVDVLDASGDLYWCRGMHLAFSTALARGFDHYLWLNDDTLLRPDALARLLRCERDTALAAGAPVIVVGSTLDATTGAVSYGGERLPNRWRRLRAQRVAPATIAQRCDSMAGNIVLVSAAAAQRVGNLDAAFEHAMGDTDYALRAAACGVQVWLGDGTHGTCSGNVQRSTWCDAAAPLAVRWRDMHTRKGLPWRSWLRFTRRHAGPLWPLHFAAPYLKVLAQGLLRALRPAPRQRTSDTSA